MKTIAIVLNTSWNIYNFRLNLMRALKKKGYRVIALAPYDEYSDKLKREGFEWINLSLNNDSTNPLTELKQIRNFYLMYKYIKPDIILQYTIKPNLYGTLAAFLLNIPVINNVSGLGTVFVQKKFIYKIVRLLYRILLHFPKKIFFQNRYDRELFIKEKLVKENISEVIPGSGVDTSRFFPIEGRKKSSDIITFLMVSRLIKDKGIKEYIAAVQSLKIKYPKVRFQLIGSLYFGNPSAISKQELESWINNGIIEYLEFSDNMENIISKSDCIVLPSYREGLSRVLLESASMAKPIVTTDVAGCKDIVDHGVNGFLCKVKSSKSLSEEMEKIIVMSEENRISMGKKGRKKVLLEFDEKLVIKKYLSEISYIFKNI